MIPNQIPSALEIFNKETIERKCNVREILGLKRSHNSYSGMYGVDFCWETAPVENSNYIPCMEGGCSFRGPQSMMEFHVKTVHEAGLDSRFDVETETWRTHRKQNFPKSSNVKSNTDIPSNRAEIKKVHNRGKRNQNVVKIEKPEDSVNIFHNDPMLEIFNKPKPDANIDLLGLGALYGSSDEEQETVEEKPVENKEYIGLPTPDQLEPAQLKQRRNKYRFPILPQMDLQSKRHALMNPQRRYHETYNRKAKRPRLADLLLAEELCSETNSVLQCVRYVVNMFFFDPAVEKSAATHTVRNNSIDGPQLDLPQQDQGEDEREMDVEAFFDKSNDQEIDYEDAIIWSDEDL